MGKKKSKGEYNDFLEDARPRDNNEIRTTLQSTSTLARNISPSAISKQQSQHRNNTNSKSNPKKPPLTHFLCLPLISDSNRSQISTALEQLRKDVEAHTPVPPKAVRPVGTLHLTLGVMSLSPPQLARATQHLSDLNISQLLRGITTQKLAESAADTPTVSESLGAVQNPPIHPPNPVLAAPPHALPVQLAGLVPMQTPRRTSILYAEPRDASGRLVGFAESLRSSFEDEGLVVRDERGLRLHATLLNTVYAKPKGRGRRKPSAGGSTAEVRAGGADAGEEKDGLEEQSKGLGLGAESWMRFDASSLMEMYKDFVWAEDVRIDRVQICAMGAQKVLDSDSGEVVDEKYTVVAEKLL